MHKGEGMMADHALHSRWQSSFHTVCNASGPRCNFNTHCLISSVFWGLQTIYMDHFATCSEFLFWCMQMWMQTWKHCYSDKNLEAWSLAFSAMHWTHELKFLRRSNQMMPIMWGMALHQTSWCALVMHPTILPQREVPHGSTWFMPTLTSDGHFPLQWFIPITSSLLLDVPNSYIKSFPVSWGLALGKTFNFC